jgi:hypothetical protein
LHFRLPTTYDCGEYKAELWKGKKMATGSPYQRRSSEDDIAMEMGKPQLTQTISNAYTISPELFEKVLFSPFIELKESTD